MLHLITQPQSILNLKFVVPNDKCRLLIGAGGRTIKGINKKSGAYCEIVQSKNNENEEDKPKSFTLCGNPDEIEIAKKMIEDVLGIDITFMPVGMSSCQSPEDSIEQSIQYRTYKKRPGAVDKGKEYEILMCALYAFKFGTSEDVADFEMSTNNAECGDFDDIKLEVTYKEGTKHVYLFQLKYKQNLTRITEKNLAAEPTPKNEFSLIKHLKAVSAKNDKETIFILCTNSPTNLKDGKEFVLESQDSVMVKGCTNLKSKGLLMNSKTSNESAVFQFELTKNSSNSNVNSEALKQFYFLTKQKNVDQVKLLLKKELKDLLKCGISQSYILFIQDWYLQNFVLTKHDLITKLTELALFPYIQVISAKKCNEKSKQLEEAVMEHEVTLMENGEEIVENIWKAAEDDCYSMMYLKKFGLTPTDDSPEMQKTKLQWYLNQAPLIVKVNTANKESVLSVMKLLKTDLQCKKIVLLGDLKKSDFSHDWTIFENLWDVLSYCKNKQCIRNILDNFYVSLQGRQHISLEKLVESDEEMASIIGTKELFIMSQEHFLQIGDQKLELPDSYIARTLPTVILDVAKTLDQCSQIKKCIVIVNCQHFKETLQLKPFAVMELSEYLDAENNQAFDSLVLLSTEIQCTCIQFEQVCTKSAESDVYVLQTIDDNCATLLLRKGNQLDVKLVAHEIKSVEQEEIFTYFNNSVNVICAPPGMGKSTLLSSICNTCPPEYWCIYVNLINHNGFLSTRPNPDQLWKHFLDLQQSNQVTAKIVNNRFKSKKILLFLDGLDEVDSGYIKMLLGFIKHVSSEKVKVWVSSRENLREMIVEDLGVVTIEIEELNQKQQKEYISERLQNKYNAEEIETIAEAIFNNADVTHSQQMLGIPLQLYIITENLLEAKSSTYLHEPNNFVLTKMYQNFFEMKKKFAYQKVGVDQHLEHQLGLNFSDILKKYEMPALQTCLDKTHFVTLNLDSNENKVFIETITKQGDKFGIIKQIGEDGQVVFVHQTYAEYFASVWLKRHLDKANLLRDELFSEKYQNLRIIFDIMLAEQHSLHLAVIYKSVQETEKNIMDVNVTDPCGRSALHLACSYGIKYCQHDDFDFVYNYSPHQESESYEKIFEMLLESHNALNCYDLFGLNFVDYSFRARCLYPVEKLLEKHLVASEDYKKFESYYTAETLVFYACLYGYSQILSHILNYNSHVLKSGKFDKISLLDVVTIGSKFAATNKNKINRFSRFVDVLQLLLKHGVDVNQLNSNGNSALKFASGQGNVEIVKTLLEKEADINMLDNEGMNALHYACKSPVGNTELVEVLINAGININARDKSGMVALHFACIESNVEIVMKLLEKGADINVVDNDDMIALHYVFQSVAPSLKLVEMLTDDLFSINVSNKSGKVALHIACAEGNIEIVKTLLEKGATIDVVDNEDRNALHYVLQSMIPNAELVKTLIEHGISVNARDKSGKVALHNACAEGNIEIVKILLEKEANVNLLDNEDRNALHYVFQALKPSTELVEILIKHGISVNAADILGKVPLHNACTEGHVEIAKKLLEKGADINTFDNEHQTALHYAFQSTNAPSLELIDLLNEHKININEPDRFGRVALHIASEKGHVEIVRKLIETGAKINALNNKNENALLYAYWSKTQNPELIELLKSHGLSVSLYNHYTYWMSTVLTPKG